MYGRCASTTYFIRPPAMRRMVLSASGRTGVPTRSCFSRPWFTASRQARASGLLAKIESIGIDQSMHSAAVR